MDIIICDSNYMEKGFLLKYESIDFSIGKDNTFQIVIDYSSYDSELLERGDFIFIPDTEYGGIVKTIKSSSEDNTVTFSGYTIRGQLEKKVLEPPKGSDYYIATGNVQTVLNNVMSDKFPELYKTSESLTDKTVNKYKFPRYWSFLRCFKKMLESVGCRLNIVIKQGRTSEPCFFEVQAVEIEDLSSQIQYDLNTNNNYTIEDNQMGVNHLIILGKGQLKDRIIKHMWVKNSDGSYPTGMELIEAVYDYNSYEDEDDLIQNATENFNTLKSSQSASIFINDTNRNIGDIVSVKDYITGILVSKTISSIIFKISNATYTIEYGVEDESEEEELIYD